MKRLATIIIALCALLSVNAQESTSAFRFGFLSYESALQSMPDYAKAQQKIDALKAQYQAETKRVEDEFNRKYEEFLEGQRDFPKTILQKRQMELQELMERNIQFKEQSRKELAQIEKDTMAPLRIRLIEQLGKIGRERGYAFIYDTDTNALPFINPDMGEDLNLLVRNALK
jgi:outer membrane protein